MLTVFLYRLVSSTLTFCSFRFCETRCLDDRPVADRAIEVWPSVVKCVAYWESLSRSRHPQINSYEQLVECCSDPLVSAKLHFFLFVAGIFEPYLTRFQTDAPMVSFIFDDFSAIFKKLVGLIPKKDAIDNPRSIASMLNEKWLQDSKNQLEPGLVDIGAGTKAVLASAQVAAEKKRLFRYECKQIIIKIFIKLAERCPLQFSLVRVASSLASSLDSVQS